MSASFENETIDKADKQYSIGTKKLNLNQNKFNEDTKTIDVECSLWYLQPTHGSRKKWNCIIYCPGPDIPFGFNALSFLDLTIPPIPIENVFVSSDLNLSFSKGITSTALELGRHKSVIIVIMMKNIKKMDVWEIKQMEI